MGLHWLRDYFEVEKRGSDLKTEFRASLTLFLAMAYILVINPQILSQAMGPEDPEIFRQLVIVTGLAAAVGSILMGIIANYPFALAPGMGTNAYFAFTVVIGLGIPWQEALTSVALSGVLFILTSIFGLRRWMIQAFPPAIRSGTTVGLGLFLAFIGLQNAGLVKADPATLVTLGSLGESSTILAIIGLIIMLGFSYYRVSGGFLLGILIVTFLSFFVGENQVDASLKLTWFQWPEWPDRFIGAWRLPNNWTDTIWTSIFIFFFVDLFDTAGTLTGLGKRAGFFNENGELPKADRAFLADALATTVGAWLGTSTTTSYLESVTAVEEGGRTGLVAIFVGFWFLLALFFWPLISKIPIVATAPVLILLGAGMAGELGQINWNSIDDSFPAFVTFIAMPLTFSIANGICFGLLAYVLVRLISGRWRTVSWPMWIVSTLIVAKYAMI